MYLIQNLVGVLTIQALTASAANLPWSRIHPWNPVPTSTLPPPTSSPYCTDPNTGTPGQGGCSQDCYCDSSISGLAYCASSGDVCTAQCGTDADCGPDSFCSNRTLCGYPFCESTVNCTSTAGFPENDHVRSWLGIGSH